MSLVITSTINCKSFSPTRPFPSWINGDNSPSLSLLGEISAAFSRRSSTIFLTRVSCAKSPDDYHATLKSLNSRGRFPRKSLGQVLTPSLSFSVPLVDTYIPLLYTFDLILCLVETNGRTPCAHVYPCVLYCQFFVYYNIWAK